MRKIKVAFLIDSLHVGGAQRMLLNFCRFMDKRRFDISIIYWRDGSLTKEFQNLGVRLYNLGIYPRKRGLTHKLRVFALHQRRLYKVLRRLRPHVVQTTLPVSDLYGALGKLYTRTRVVCRKAIMYKKTWYERWYFKLLSLAQDRIICTSRTIRQSLMEEGISPERLTTVYNGIDLTEFTPSYKPTGELNFVFAGRFDKDQKGLDVLIETLKRLERSHSGYFMYFVGGQTEEEVKGLKEMCQEAGLQRYRIDPATTDLNSYFADKHVLLLPSRRESFPTILPEAMACGLPCIASNVAAVPEIIKHKRHGFLINKEDAEDLLKRMKYCIENPGQVNEMGKQARRYIEETFSIKRATRGHEQVYEELVRR